jgi:hypothetical protein
MYVQRNIAARSRVHCCNINGTVRSTSTDELRLTVNNIKTLGFAQQCFYGECVWLTTINVLRSSCDVSGIFVQF